MSQRIKRVNELLKREISHVLQRDFEFPGSLVSVTDVVATHDLREAKVLISIMGKTSGVFEKIVAKRGFIQTRVSKRVTLKHFPVFLLRQTNALERGNEIVDLLQEVEHLPQAPIVEDEDLDL